jgi:hypothetical protein
LFYLKDELQTANGIQKIGIILDRDNETEASRIQLVNTAIKDVFDILEVQRIDGFHGFIFLGGCGSISYFIFTLFKETYLSDTVFVSSFNFVIKRSRS